MNLEDLRKVLRDAGDVGAGGAAFPTAMKVAEGADTLIINAAECEPLLYTDYVLMKRHMDRVVGGAEYVLAATGIKKAFLALKKHTAERLSLTHGQKLSNGVEVYALPDVYPMGDEIILIYEVLRRVVQPGSLPITAGVLVFNVETLYNVYKAIEYNEPVTEKWVTIGGQVKDRKVIKVPVGTPVSYLMEKHGFTVSDDQVIIDGGPAMGGIINPQTAVITKTTKGLLVLPKSIPAIASKLGNARTARTHATSNCCQCTRCTDMCPRALIGYPLSPHKVVRGVSIDMEEHPENYIDAALCCSCGVCELVACCQQISPRRVFAEVKGLLAKKGIRYTYKGQNPVDPDREFRMLPVERFKQLIGVAPFDHVTEFQHSNAWKPNIVRLPLKQHVGAPAKPVVNVGDTVVENQIVAEASAPISASIHTAIAGRVTKITDTELVIEA